MVKYHGRARMRTGAVNTNQVSFNLSGTGSSVGARTRYTKKRVCNNLKVCGNVHYQGRIWSNNQKKDGKCGSCLPATTTCPTAGGVGRVNAPRLLCGNYYKNEEPTPPTLTLDVTNIQRVLLGNVAQTLGSASVTTSLPSTVGTVYSLVEPIPAGFSINSSTGELSFAGGITGYGNMNTLPDTIKIKASLNPGDEVRVVFWHGRLGATYGVRMIANKENWDEDLEGYYYLEEKNSVLAMTVGAQDVDPTTPGLKTRILCSTIYDNQGRYTTINGVTRGVKTELETRVSSIPVGERTITLSGGPRPVSEGSDSVFSYDITNKKDHVEFSLNIAGLNGLTLTFDRDSDQINFNRDGSIDQTTGTVSSESTLGLTLTTIGQSTEYIGRGIWNPYINIPDTPTEFRQSVDPGEIYTMFSDRYGTSRPPFPTPITYNESARINFDYTWIWGIGNFKPATYLPPLNPEFSNIFSEPNGSCDIPRNCPLYPNANNFAVGGCSFLADQVSPTQDPPQPTLYGGINVDVPYQDPIMIRVFNFKRTDGKLSTPIMIQGRCEYLPTNFDSPCGAEYTDGPLKCDDTDLLSGLQSRSSNIPSFNSLIQYILDGAGDDAERNQGPYSQSDYEIIDVPNGAVAIVLSTQFRESQEGVNDAPPAKFYVYLAKLDSDENPSSTVLNPSTDYDMRSAEQPQTITTGDGCNFSQDFMGYTNDGYGFEGWGEVVLNRDDNNVITASYSTKNKYDGDDIYTTEKGTMIFGPLLENLD